MDNKPINRITADDVAIMRDLGSRFSLNGYQGLSTKSAIYPGQGTPLGLAYVALKLNGEAGEFAEHVGKAMRDDELMPVGDMPDLETGHEITVAGLMGGLTPERRALIIKEIGDVLWYLSAACNELGITLQEAAATNIEKLYDRTQRDALRGSGDER